MGLRGGASLTLRIATVMAGNRQQSRFLALLSSYDRLVELSDVAANSENAATLQMLKTMDSIEFKTQQLQTSLQSLYTDGGLETFYKYILDIGNAIVKQWGKMPKLLGIPVGMIGDLGTQFFNLANIVTTVFKFIRHHLVSETRITQTLIDGLRQTSVDSEKTREEQLTDFILEQERLRVISHQEAQEAMRRADNDRIANAMEGQQALNNSANTNIPTKRFGSTTKILTGVSALTSLVSLGLNAAAVNNKNNGNVQTGGILGATSTALSGVAMGAHFGWLGILVGGLLGSILGVINNKGFIFESDESKLKRNQEKASETNNEYLLQKNETKTLQQQIEKLRELDKARHNSTEAQEEYNAAAAEMIDKYPNLIQSIDEAGNAIVNLDAAERELTKSRKEAVDAALKNARQQQVTALQEKALSDEEVKAAINGQLYIGQNDRLGSLLLRQFRREFPSFYRTIESYSSFADFVKDFNDYHSDFPKDLRKKMAEAYSDSGLIKYTEPEKNNGKNGYYTIQEETNAIDFLNAMTSKMGKSAHDPKTGKFVEQNLKNTNIGNINFQEFWEHFLIDGLATDELLEGFNFLAEDKTEVLIEGLVDPALKAFLMGFRDLALQSLSSLYENKQTEMAFRRTVHSTNMGLSDSLLSGYNFTMDNANDILTAAFDQALLPETGVLPTEDVINYFYQNNGYQNYYDRVLTELLEFEKNSPKKIEQYNNLINNGHNMNETAFTEELKNFIDETSLLYNYIVSSLFNTNTYSYDDFLLAIEKRDDYSLKDGLNKILNLDKNLWLQHLSENHYKMLLSYYDQLQDYVDAGELTSGDANALLEEYISLIGQIEQSSLDWQDKGKLLDITMAWDGTPQGLQTLQEQLIELGLEVGDTVQNIIDLLPTNFNTERQLLLDQYASANEDFLSWAEKARKGMGIKDATTFAQTFGLDLMSDQFTRENGKWYYTDFGEIFKHYYEDLNPQAKSYRQDLKKAKKISKQYNGQTIDWKDILAQLQDDESSIRDEFFDTVLENSGLKKGQFLDILYEYGAALAKGVDIDFFAWLDQYLKEISIDLDQQAKEAWAGFEFDSKQFSKMFAALGINSDKLVKDFINGVDKNWNWNSALKGYAAEYGTQIVSNYSSFIDTLSKNFLSGEEIKFENNDMNRTWLEQAGIKIDESTAEALYISSKLTAEQWRSLIASIPEAAGAENRKKAYDILYDSYTNNNLAQALLDAAGSTEALSEDQANALASAIFGETTHALESGLFEMLADGTFRFVGDLQTALTTALNSGLMSLKNYNEAIGKIREADFDLSASSIISDIISNRDKISSDNIESLANLLKVQYETVEKFFKNNGDGTFSADISQIENLVLSFGLQTNEAIQSALTDIFDSILSDLTGLAGNQTQGFTGIADMQKYIKQVNDQLGTHLVMQDMFQWSDSLHAFIFTTEGLQNQVRSMTQQLAYMSEEERWAAQKLIQDTGRQFAESIDIFSYINAESSGERDKAEAALRQAVKDYDSYLYSIGNHSYVWISSLMSALEEGGQVAVAAGEQIAALQGKTLTADEVTSLYYASSQGFADAFEALGSYAAGSMMTLSNAVIKALEGAKDIDSALVRIGNTNQFVVKDTKKLVDVYTQLYEQLKTNTNATLAEVNEAYARLAMLNSDNDLIEALNNGSAMSIDTLSEFATKAGYTLEGVIKAFTQANILLDIGGGNYRILDFDRFAKEMNLGDSTSEEYQKALKSYNDGLIEAERYFTEEIIDEVTGLKDAKLGTKVNLTSFEQALFKNADFSDRLDFRTQLFNMGALLKDGVLDIQSQANLPGIIQLINKYAAQYGGLLESEVAELADTLRDVLNSFAEALSKGISGTLTNVEATDLAANAKNMYGIDLRFTQTAEGLKVSTDQAIQLYNRMSQVDSISSKIVFDDLAEELTAAGAACETMSSTLAEIKRLEKEGTSAAQERLNVYRQIAATQMNNPDSYNFMDKKLSNGMQGPVNYWNSVGEMFKTWNEAKANGGKIDVQDFYNIVNELNNLAAIGGDIEFLGHKLDGNMESAAQLINEGMAALTNIDGEGVKVDLSKFAAEFLTGTTNMGAGVEDGIHAMAQSQMDMLDGLIKLLETIKAMEKLGEIDANTDGVLAFDEMFGELSGGFYEVTDKAQNAAKAILDQANQSEELNKNLSLIKFNDTSLLEMLTTMANDGKVAKDQAHLYNQVMSALYQMVLSGDYDLENLQESILQLMQVNGAIGEIDLGNGIKFAVGYGVTLQPNEKNEYVIGDHTYPATQVKQALADAAFANLGLQDSRNEVVYNTDTNRYEQKLTVTDGVSMTLAMDGEGNFKYQVRGQDYDSYKEALYAIWINTLTTDDVDQKEVASAVAKAMEKGYEAPGFLKWLATVGEEPIVLPTPSLEIDTSNLKSYTQEAIKKAQTEAIKWANGVDAKNIDFDALTSIGINISADTERSWGNIQQVFSALDIEDKTMNFDVTTNPEDEAAASIIDAMNSDKPIVKEVILKLISEGEKWLQDLFTSGSTSVVEENNNTKRNTHTIAKIDELKDAYMDENDSLSVEYKAEKAFQAAMKNHNFESIEQLSDWADVLEGNKSTNDLIYNYVIDLFISKINKEIEYRKQQQKITDEHTYDPNAAEEATKGRETAIKDAYTKQDLAEKDNKITELTTDNISLQNQLTEQAQTLANAQEALSSAENEYNNLKIKYDNLQYANNDTITTLVNDLTLANQQKAEVQAQIDIWKGIVQDNKQKLDQANNKIANLNSDISTLENTVSAQSTEIETLKAEKETLQSTINKLETDKKNAEAQVENLLDELTQAQAKILALEGALEEKAPENMPIDIHEKELVALMDYLQNGETYSSNQETEMISGYPGPGNVSFSLETWISYWKDIWENNNGNKTNTHEEENPDTVNINGEKVILSGNDEEHPFYGADKGETPPSINETVWNGLDETIRNDIIYFYREFMPAGGDFKSYYEKHQVDENDWPKFSELFPEDAAETLAATGEEFAATTLAATTGLTYMGGQFITLTEQTGTAQDGVSALGNASSVTGGKAYVGRNGINSFGTAIGKFTTDLIDQTTKLANTKIRMPSITPAIPPIVRAKGNVALAAGNQHTLMGELGPELVVSNGHYFVAGQNGAEFVNLPADAIVFNHLQTEQLLKNGSSGRGKAVTNERKATSMATGNAHGPAFAGGIDAAIAELKRIYAMWKALDEATSKDMGMLAGSGGGGGGGGGKGIDKGFIEDLERWYTILQQIAKLERDINYEEKLRTKLNSDLNKNGYEYYDSQVRSLKSINEQIGKQRELVSLQQGYLNERVNDLNSSVWGQIYHATEDMITYNDTSENAGIRLLAELMRQKENNELVHTGKEQYDILVKNIPGIEEFLKFDPKGEEINTDEDGYGKAVEGFLETADARKDEIQDLIDSVADTKNEILDNENTRNQILQDMMDNQLSLEQEIVKAIEEREQAIIDNLKDTRDALDEAQNAFIDGLSDQLDKERNMYDKQQANEDLNKLRRQLSILQRSGGSASSIASLQEQIRSNEQDTYFEAQQQQIDAIKEASDKEIERLDAQIDLMTETLEYQKEHGLLWNEVYQIMAMEEADILAFIQSNGKDWESKSSLQIEKDIQALKYIIERYIGRREDSDKYVEEALADTTVSQSQNIEPFQPHHDKKEGSSSSSSSSSGKTGGGGGGSSGSGGYSGNSNNLNKNNTNKTDDVKRWRVTASNPSKSNITLTADFYGKNRATAWDQFWKKYPDYSNLIDVTPYKTGGLVDYTGFAMVHGSKSKPEAFIDADTTKFIMDELKGKNGLLELANRMKQDTIENKKSISTASPVLQQLRQIREMWNDLQNQAYATVQSASEAQRNEASVIIENATVEVNVPSVANDYDSRRIGSQALDEMLRIARKTTSVSINGR